MKETIAESKLSLVQQCINMLKREDIKNEIKSLFKPVIDFILCEITPYIYIIMTVVILVFIMILAILIVLIFLLRNKQVINKNF